MAIVRLSKVTVFGLAAEKARVLEKLQSLGCLHLVNLRETGVVREPLPAIALEAHESLKYLRSCPIQRPAAERQTGFDFESIVAESKQIQERDRELRDERDNLTKSVEMARPWGEFEVPPLDVLAGIAPWFYLVPADKAARLESVKAPWEIVGRSGRHECVVVLSEQEPSGVPGVRVELDARPISKLEERIARVDIEIEDLQLKRAGMTRWIPLIERSLAEADDEAGLRHAMQHTLEDSAVFAVQGWAPKKSVGAIESFAADNHLALSVEDPSESDAPPTLFKNPEFLAGGETAVTFYMTPGYRSWDPSLIVLFSFATFFAMIFADAGYSLLLAAVLGLSWKPLSRSEAGIRFRNLFAIIVGFSLVYGVALGSYFGVVPSKIPVIGGVLDAVRIPYLEMSGEKDYGRIMMLSILIGASHLVIANSVVAWHNRGTLRALVNVGWVLNIVGGLIAGLSGFQVIGELYFWVGIAMLCIGSVLVLFFASSRPFPPKSVGEGLLRFVDGLLSLTSISAAFGDVLSYLRLFALGLASGQLAATFNGLAHDVGVSLGGIGTVLAILVLVLGHALNFVLGIMSGVVHGLRLNCIEFFNWSALDEGYPFRAFSKKAGS